MRATPAAIAAWLLLACPLAHAECEEPVVTVCDAYFASDKVFQGRILESTSVFDPDDPRQAIDHYRYKLKVERNFRGRTGKLEIVSSRGFAPGKWGYGMHPVIFTRKGAIGGQCSPIVATDRSGEVMAQLMAIANTPRAYLTPADCPPLPRD
jgi:hypothetical protein